MTKEENGGAGKRTLDDHCILASRCRFAGDEAKCNDMCGAFAQMHSATGRHTLAGLPQDYRLVTAANSPVRAEQPHVYRHVDAYIETFDRQFEVDGEYIRSVYLFSAEPGTGKTTTAAALLNEYIAHHYAGAKKRGQTPAKRPGYFLDVNRWQALFNRVYMASGDRRDELAAQFEDERRKAEQAQFAVFDDIGVRESTTGFKTHLHDVINTRVTERRPTVFTSNVPIDKLRDLFGDDRLPDRIRDLCVVLSPEGGSKRGNKRTR
ncbi:DNA replication protein [Salibacterium aidingense]|uniref:DNA replication protein n=1 Tax=Salibacterium aidingense TaxID=384933 RepID=UPI003BC7DD53